MAQRARRILSYEGVLGGKPVLEGTRLSVEFVLELLESGMSTAEILDEYPELTRGDLRTLLHFAKQAVSREEVHRIQPRAAV